MWDRILVPVDGSDSATAALEHALDVAARDGATVHLLYVADTNQPSLSTVGTEVVDALEEEGAGIVSSARERAAERGVSVVDEVVQGDPREVIVEAANADPTDLVVMGTTGRHGLSEYLLGSVTEHVVTASETPVVTVRPADDVARYPYRNVLVPTDGSDHARAAVELGAEIASRHDARLHLLFVVDEAVESLDTDSADLLGEEMGRELLDAATAVAADHGVEDVETAIEVGPVPREIVAYTESAGIDLVAMGTHGRTGLDKLLLGSFAERVLRTAPVPVLTTTATAD